MNEQQQPWGRVAEDGTVFVRLPDGGEARVGQYAAGSPEEALAFYARKYADVAAEVDLMIGRIRAGRAEPDRAEEMVARVREALQAPTFVGDIAGLQHQLDTLHAAAAERRLTAQAEAARLKAEAVARREALVAEAEALAGSTAWKATGDRFRELFEEWKQAPRIAKSTENALWDRFKTARHAFDKARRTHFAELDAARSAAAQVKQDIVARAEALAGSTDWAATSAELRSLMDQWKAAARAGRDDEERLWKRFKLAQDTFFGARNADLAERDAGQDANLRAKKDLLARAEALLPVTDLAAARRALRDIQEAWESVGFVPRNAKADLESRLRRVERAVHDAERDQWRRTDPAARARAEATVAQFSKSVAALQADLAAAQERGDDAKARRLASALDSSRALLAAAEGALAEFSAS